MNNPTQTIIKIFTLIIVILSSLIIIGALWNTAYNPLMTLSASKFPLEQVNRLHAAIQQVFSHPSILDHSLRTRTIQQSALRWTSYEYTVHIARPADVSEVAYTFSEAIEAGEGKIFQTYYRSTAQKATLVAGIESYITHTIVLTWDLPSTATPIPEKQSKDTTAQFRAAIVIDDLGASKQVAYRLLNLHEDFTFSILPHLEDSTAIARLLHERHKETLLHLPMEPQNYPAQFPGKGAIMMDMPAESVQAMIQQNLQTVPFVVGVNNHMGSRLTADREQMQTVLEVLRERQLFFLDSRTTAKTVAYSLAKQLGLQAAKRKVFLDVFADPAFVKGQLYELAALAEQGQPAIAIGHPKEATLQALEEVLPEFRQRHIQIVRVSELVD